MQVLLEKEKSFLGLNSDNPIHVISERIRKSHSEESIKNTLRRLSRILFTSDIHYDYYNVYVKPKISLVGKTYEKKSVARYADKERHHTTMNITISDNYIVIGFIRSIERIRDRDRSYYYGDDIRTTSNVYLLGLDSSGKLFVNKVDWVLPIEGSKIIKDTNNIAIYEIEDRVIKSMLGFDISTDALEEVIISNGGRYRIQGEIVMTLNGWRFGDIKSIEDLKRYIESTLSLQISSYVWYLALDKLALVLSNMGYSISPVRIDGVERLAVIESHRGVEEGRRKAAALAKELCYNISCKDLFIDEYMLVMKAYVHDADIGDMVLNIVNNGVPYGERYGDILIRLDLEKPGRLKDILLEDLRKQLERLRPRNYRFAIGNHIIEIENAISTNLSYMPNIQPLILPSRPLSTNLDAYYVDSESIVRISHPEHGINIIRFARPFAAEFGTTNISSRYPGEVNRLLLNKAVRKHIIKC